MFGEQKFSILEVESGKDGIELIKNEKPFLILTEFYLPDITIYELCEKIKDDVNIADIPIIVLSTENNEGNIKKCLKLGVKSFLEKPVSAKVLFTAIEDISDNLQSREETILCVDDSNLIRKIFAG